MYTEDKKRIMRRYDIIEKSKKSALEHTLFYAIIQASVTLICGGAGTGAMIAAFTETNGFAVLIIFFVLGSLALWAIPVANAVFMVRNAIPYIAILQGKFTFEIDRANFSTPKTYQIKDSVFTVYVTHFEKHGTFELRYPPAMGQEFYVLAVLTKKPRIIAAYDTEKYEIVER